MGMFDYLRCEPNTPDGWKPKDGLFQTKDLDCDLVTHTITKDGRLLRGGITHEGVIPKQERPYPDMPGDHIMAMVGSFRKDTHQTNDDEFHGWLNFYAGQYVEDQNGNVVHTRYGWLHNGGADQSIDGKRYRYVLHDYRAKFTGGRLVKIDMLTSSSLKHKDTMR